MSEQAKDGGPAFGGAYDDVYFSDVAPHLTGKIERRVPGMTLRDYFAGQVLAGVLASSRRLIADNGEIVTGLRIEQVAQHYARESYAIADAMLAERSKG